MNKDKRYKYMGMPLTDEVAAKILFEWIETDEFHISVWMEKINTHHISCGGLPAKGNLEHILRSALSTLRRFGRAENSGQWWTIHTLKKNSTPKHPSDKIREESTNAPDSGYKYQGKPLTREIASETIFNMYAGKPPVDFKTILERVSQYHENKGGLPAAERRGSWVIHRALSLLKTQKCATPMEGNVWDRSWRIHEEDIHYYERDYPKTIGNGSGSVYLYYYPIYKREAKTQRQLFWKCKIGYTNRDAGHRAKEQVRTGLPEPPITALTIKTDEPAVLEKKIQSILKILDRYADDGPRNRMVFYFSEPSGINL